MLTIDTSNRILINGCDTGLAMTQRREGTVIYTPESRANGARYQEHKMPHARYSAAHDNPRPLHATPELAAKYKTAGRAHLEVDVLALLARLDAPRS